MRAAEEDHPVADRKRCANQIQRKLSCANCEIACPAQVFGDLAKPDYTKCDGCGICAAHCLSGAIAASHMQVQRVLELLNMLGEKVTLGCRKSTKDADSRLECLAAYPWEALACLILQGKKIAFVQGDCESCAHQKQMVLHQRSMEKLSLFLGEQRMNEALSQDTSPLAVTRREALRSMLQMGKRTAAVVMPMDARQKPDGNLFRKLLLYHARHANDEKGEGERISVGWTTPVFSDACKACGICAKVCPNGALQVHTAQDGTISMVHFGWKCRGCGICEAACPWEGIRGYGIMNTDQPDVPFVIRTNAHPCERCGSPCAADEQLCMNCRLDEQKDSHPFFCR